LLNNGSRVSNEISSCEKLFKKKLKNFSLPQKRGGADGVSHFIAPSEKQMTVSLFILSLSLFSSISHFASLFLLFKSFFGVGGVSPAQLPLSLFFSV
jgi:hypothetical protein